MTRPSYRQCWRCCCRTRHTYEDDRVTNQPGRWICADCGYVLGTQPMPFRQRMHEARLAKDRAWKKYSRCQNEMNFRHWQDAYHEWQGFTDRELIIADTERRVYE